MIRLPIRNERGNPIATFENLGAKDLDNEELLALLTAWRQKYMSMFMTQFVATVDRTRAWLSRVIHSPDRAMFLIRSHDGQPLGQFGLCCHDEETIELDNGILGAETGPAGLFYHAERGMLGIGFELLDMRRAIARVFSKNVFAIKLHKRVGLAVQASDSLLLELAPNGDRCYRIAEPGVETDVPFELLTLGIERDAFRQRSAELERE